MTTPAVYLVGLDGSSAADHVLEVACGLGRALGGTAELHLIHVLGVMPEGRALKTAPLVTPTDQLEVGRNLLDAASAYAAARFAGRIAGHLAVGDASREIVQMAANVRADLVVVGTAGKTGVERLVLGSVSELVVRAAGCPVLVVRPKDYHARVIADIEPPCAQCVAVQNETARAKLWCARHSAPHARGRLHYEVPPSFALGTMLLRP